MSAVTALMVLSRVVAVALAHSLAVTSYRAYCRTRERPFRFSMAGFVLFSLGLGLGSYTLYARSLRETGIHVLQSSVLAIGFVILYLSITKLQRNPSA